MEPVEKNPLRMDAGSFMVKFCPPPKNIGATWRDGRAAEGACLENMFGSHQRGFESHSLRSAIYN